MTNLIQTPLQTVKVTVDDCKKIKTESDNSTKEVVKEMKILTE